MAFSAQDISLTYSDCRRLHCGLHWDPDESSDKPVDLDLIYVLYDEFGRHIKTVSGKDGSRRNDQVGFYHSGDEADGADEADDERVTVDLLGLPSSIHYIFMAVEISSRHTFGNVRNPQARILKGVENEVLLDIKLTEKAGAGTKGYAFVRLDRQSGGWLLHTVNQYLTGATLPEWEHSLIDYLPQISDEKKSKSTLPPAPKRGETVPLSYTKQAMQRILCGISWDEQQGKYATIVDVDLTCILYDAAGKYVDDVSSDPSRAIDKSGAVYHSGDDVSGSGGGDDETISVELAKLPAAIHHAVFVVDMKTNHSLSDIVNPAIRIADGMSNQNQLEVAFTDSGNNNAYIFARLFRQDDAWMLHYIGQAIDTGKNVGLVGRDRALS